MKVIKTLFAKRFHTLNLIVMFMAFSFILLTIRVTITKTTSFLFLVWNVILAFIPFIITMYFSNKKKNNKIMLVLAGICWLLFLPNAPYIITDLYHLKGSSYSFIWIDTLVISTFAATGLLFFYLSLTDAKIILERFLKKKYARFIISFICFLSAFGIYLGRFLRYNSWEVLSNPSLLFKDIFKMVSQPQENTEVWLFTLCFGLFLALGFYTFQHLAKLNSNA